MINNIIRKFKIFDNKNIMIFSLLILIFFVFLQEFKIFRNVYYLINKNHYERASKAYEKTFFSGYCKGSSHGYLFYIKNKYSEKFIENKIPKIINNFNGKKEYWIFLNINAEIDDQQMIILNNQNNIDSNKFNIIDKSNNCLFVEKK